ncbi:mechanosensitive ion channel protein MscS [Moorena producens PAL-8-15-08-1]|uniref:Mechanosensitive ion channel protein MscS n=1 Tax=Moorena producens PAL-8-15-08-1 TaxID=1458985 RepID=A0A1D8TPY0_9CYAN|nr:mechanosensitive ion channel family protein [Moorena producens]AOW99709.1 mechanosensitive ion channel protein MscS [Moorena producens PAL-8-15-08-1]
MVETITKTLKELLSSAIKLFPGLLSAIIIIFLTRYFAEFIQKLASQLGTRMIRSHSLQLLLSKTCYVAVWVIGILVASVIAFPGLRLGDIVATLGLTSVAIGFAFQDIFKNFLAGVLLLLQEPFRINDQVIIGDYEGTVEQIDIRTTKIRTYQGERVILPNSTVFTSAVQVRTSFSSRRTDLTVGVDYNTPLPKAVETLQRLVNGVEGVLDSPALEVDLVSFGDSSIDFVVRYWTLPQQKEVRRVKTRVIIAIKKAFNQADINIPYPIRAVYYYDQQQFNDYLPSANNGESSNRTLLREN